MTRATAVRPACMSDDELALWNRRPTAGGRNSRRGWRGTPCDDCLLWHALEMRAEGRCNGTPGGVEEEDEEAA